MVLTGRPMLTGRPLFWAVDTLKMQISLLDIEPVDRPLRRSTDGLSKFAKSGPNQLGKDPNQAGNLQEGQGKFLNYFGRLQ